MAYEYCDDLDRLRSCFDGWDAELIPIGRSRGAVWTSVAILPSIRIIRMRTGRSVLIRGKVPAIGGCLILASPSGRPVRLRGQPLDANHFALMGKGARIDVFLPADVTLCIVVARSLADIAPRRTQMRMTTSDDVSRLLQSIEAAAEEAAPRGRNGAVRTIDDALLRQIRMAMTASTARNPGASTRSLRAGAVARACRFIDSHLGKCISLADLRRHCGVGVRTLEYGFRQLYDTTPINFIKSQRLSRTHDELLQRSALPVAIQQIATRFGFTHMGQFSQDYRLMFDESPSTTQRRARQCPDADRSALGRDDVAAELNRRLQSGRALQHPPAKVRGSGARRR